ncbi:MAG: hypothetical protein A3F26_02505 [Candidatus Ryanbacteria bacterium RIFCSPHIGHO2_12_FULL_47_12b]|uniref:Maf-like protein n=2 Tax=Candidatus Ryaniibacteriota TaxID=1817914 RepID=A0A1G2H688_9BACT|nr:MAG: Maf-like protein [Parcubacteria group bacterium GW2011_GWA2_47_10b]KKU86390.1 MAG: Maf-like protein [Parcubacteria group bacterium GW2011_GWA1_47_9]OGZ44385.1 MAG: hypothetical protein A2844_01600 [Candidatus Ryanbacteria bacterium RIFCSPHIGHO2_01_FULL_48_80]OGZ48020.1 MAG: hypothetical protein A3C83_01400 [Candidatus Ryanbacteria bacterium RIFCSPHIGHO2_02_FULL_47_25]OGZ52403.1 MAG: hypothetical protein A3F26_02505 [Candidatus Ryanbacteria bacterium RIFCSPHIGHO2_12_FULL_47_12b]OGZ52454
MKIGIIGSMHFSEKMLEIAENLKAFGHEPLLSNFVVSFSGKNDKEKERLKLDQKFNEDAMRRDWDTMKEADALLVVNLERHGIPNYIGGNTLFELAAGYFAGKKIFLWNPIPDIRYYKSEIEAVRPIIINGNLSKIS